MTTLESDNTIRVAVQLAIEQDTLDRLCITSGSLEYATPPLGFVSKQILQDIII